MEYIDEHAAECGIIYARCRATCDYLAAALNNADLEASAYHAGMDIASRHRTQADWMDGACNIVVATVAFGMGIDKADVRWVVHWNAATSLEGFYQESGRAGRDGRPSASLLYSSCADLQRPGSKTASSSAMASYCMVRLPMQPLIHAQLLQIRCYCMVGTPLNPSAALHGALLPARRSAIIFAVISA